MLAIMSLTEPTMVVKYFHFFFFLDSNLGHCGCVLLIRDIIFPSLDIVQMMMI